MRIIKKIFLSKRLDRIAPKCDRAYITIAAVILFASSMCAGLSVFLSLLSIMRIHAIAANITGYALWLTSEFIIIKETIRNRFFSAVLLLLLSITFLIALITGTVLIFEYSCPIY